MLLYTCTHLLYGVVNLFRLLKIAYTARVLRGACSQTHIKSHAVCTLKDGNTVLGDVRESGITGLSLAGWKSKSLFIWSNDYFSYFYSRFRDDK